jgi:predicted ATPase
LLAELKARGHRVFEEPGRRVVRRERETGGDALPWTNAEWFAHACIALALADLREAKVHAGLSFFDRGLVDAVSALEHMERPVPDEARRVLEARPYRDRVFMAPPWPEIYRTDAERKHGFDEARAEYDRLTLAYPHYGYGIRLLPKCAPAVRADFVLRALKD